MNIFVISTQNRVAILLHLQLCLDANHVPVRERVNKPLGTGRVKHVFVRITCDTSCTVALEVSRDMETKWSALSPKVSAH